MKRGGQRPIIISRSPALSTSRGPGSAFRSSESEFGPPRLPGRGLTHASLVVVLFVGAAAQTNGILYVLRAGIVELSVRGLGRDRDPLQRRHRGPIVFFGLRQRSLGPSQLPVCPGELLFGLRQRSLGPSQLPVCP